MPITDSPVELKVVVAGPVGAGKTTLVSALSDAPPVRTEAQRTEIDPAKPMTTVAMDYGRRHIDDGLTVAFYGTPGQERFEPMWHILSRNAFGVIMLLSAQDSDGPQALGHFLGYYEQLLGDVPTVIGISRVDCRPEAFDPLSARAGDRHPDIPVMPVDPRDPESAVLLVEALLTQIDAHGSNVLDRLQGVSGMQFRVT